MEDEHDPWHPKNGVKITKHLPAIEWCQSEALVKEGDTDYYRSVVKKEQYQWMELWRTGHKA